MRTYELRTSALKILKFDEPALRNAYVSDTEPTLVANDNPRVGLCFNHLNEIGVGILVIEEGYTDGDYLDDLANYYVRSHRDYPRVCRRLHFFCGEFSEATPAIIREQLLRPQGPDEALRKAYAGFSVVRPLHEAAVGRTVIRTYGPDGPEGTRHYEAIHTYTAHIWGVPFTVDSLAFQEQDTVLAACATVALWSALHQTAALFGTERKTPAQITQLATLTNFETRPFPSRGLKPAQMSAAIKSVGLEPEVFNCGPEAPVLSIIYAYLKARLPVILVARIKNGHHAIALNGYLLADFSDRHGYESTKKDDAIIPGIGVRIKKVYGHDDQMLPFARLETRLQPPPPKIVSEEGPMTDVHFVGSWMTDPDEKTGAKEVAPIYPIQLIIPIHHKIRLTFLDVQHHVSTFTRLLREIHPDEKEYVEQEFGNKAEWEVYLVKATEWKQELREMRKDAEPRARERLLTAQLPRYVWVARLRNPAAEMILEMVFDATGTSRSLPLVEILYFDSLLKERLFDVARTAQPQDFLAGRRLIGFLKHQIEVQDRTEEPAVTTGW